MNSPSRKKVLIAVSIVPESEMFIDSAGRTSLMFNPIDADGFHQAMCRLDAYIELAAAVLGVNTVEVVVLNDPLTS